MPRLGFCALTYFTRLGCHIAPDMHIASLMAGGAIILQADRACGGSCHLQVKLNLPWSQARSSLQWPPATVIPGHSRQG